LLFWALSLMILAGGAWLVCPSGQCGATALDSTGLGLAHSLRHLAFDGWMLVFTWFGSLLVLVPLMALACAQKSRDGQRCEAVFLMLALSGASILAHLTKLLVARPRPDLYAALVPIPIDWSYPSAHTMQAVAFAVALIFVFAKRRVLWAVLLGIAASAVGLSRIYLQVHFPSDVLAGALAALCWVAGLHALMFGGNFGKKRVHEGGEGR
jgi:undecaprenyl-diphosphatase